MRDRPRARREVRQTPLRLPFSVDEGTACVPGRSGECKANSGFETRQPSFSILGFTNFLNSFVQHLATVIEPDHGSSTPASDMSSREACR